MKRESFALAVTKELKLRNIGPSEFVRLTGFPVHVLQSLEEGNCPSVARADEILSGLGMRLTIGQATSRRKLQIGE